MMTVGNVPAYVLGCGIAGAGERGRFREWIEQIQLELLTSAGLTGRNKGSSLSVVADHLRAAALELAKAQTVIHYLRDEDTL